MNDEEPQSLPTFADLRKQMHEAPGGVLGYMLAKIRRRLEEPQPEPTTPAEEELQRIENHFIERLKRDGLLVIAFLLASVRAAITRAKTRSADLSATLTASAAAVGNVVTAAIVVSAFIATTLTQPPSRVAVAADTDARQDPRTHSRRLARIPAPDSPYQTLTLDARRQFRLGFSGTHARTSTSVAQRDDRSIVIDSSVNGWLGDETSSQKLAKINCTKSSSGKRVCAVAEPVLGFMPPPPSAG